MLKVNDYVKVVGGTAHGLPIGTKGWIGSINNKTGLISLKHCKSNFQASELQAIPLDSDALADLKNEKLKLIEQYQSELGILEEKIAWMAEVQATEFDPLEFKLFQFLRQHGKENLPEKCYQLTQTLAKLVAE